MQDGIYRNAAEMRFVAGSGLIKGDFLMAVPTLPIGMAAQEPSCRAMGQGCRPILCDCV